MKLKEFITKLNKFVEENPEALGLQVITSKDDEGNGFNLVHYAPSKGYFEDGEFTSEVYFEDDYDTNAVCIN
jgi:ubiquitin-protein ligase